MIGRTASAGEPRRNDGTILRRGERSLLEHPVGGATMWRCRARVVPQAAAAAGAARCERDGAGGWEGQRRSTAELSVRRSASIVSACPRCARRVSCAARNHDDLGRVRRVMAESSDGLVVTQSCLRQVGSDNRDAFDAAGDDQPTEGSAISEKSATPKPVPPSDARVFGFEKPGSGDVEMHPRMWRRRTPHCKTTKSKNKRATIRAPRVSCRRR